MLSSGASAAGAVEELGQRDTATDVKSAPSSHKNQGRSGLIMLLHRLGMEHRKPKAISRQLDPAKQAAFIKRYEALMNQLEADEAVMFADAVHPTHAVRPVGCWAPKDVSVAITQTSGRHRLNIHGAINLETGNTRMLEVVTVNAISTIMLLMAIETMHPGKRLIHVFVDNARYHHAKVVQQWLARPRCRIKLHFIPAYCPHLDAIERLWGLMQRCSGMSRRTKCYVGFAEFKAAVINFLREQVPRNRHRSLITSVSSTRRIFGFSVRLGTDSVCTGVWDVSIRTPTRGATPDRRSLHATAPYCVSPGHRGQLLDKKLIHKIKIVREPTGKMPGQFYLAPH